MATLTRAQMITRVLEATGIVAAGQTPQTADSTLVGELVDSCYDRLRKLELAPYAIATIPEWAQVPLRDYVAYDVAAAFGIVGPELESLMMRRQAAERTMYKQCAGYKHPLRVKADYF